MNIHTSEFAGAIGQIGQAAPASVAGLPRIVFSGRSNVGKSSLVNRFLGRTRTPIARVSQQPGKTQEINFYRVESDRGAFCLVDFPGYGFARASKALRGRWAQLIDDFLERPEGLAGVAQLIDIRHGPTADDLRVIARLAERDLPILFLLTKADKLKSSQRKATIRKVLDELGIDEEQAIPFSAVTGEGRDDLLASVATLVDMGAGATADEQASAGAGDT